MALTASYSDLKLTTGSTLPTHASGATGSGQVGCLGLTVGGIFVSSSLFSASSSRGSN